jgi:hypothetical protein
MELPWLKITPKNHAWKDVSEIVFRNAYESATSFIDVLRLLDIRYTARRRAQVPQIAIHLGLDSEKFELTKWYGRKSGGGQNWLGAEHHLRQKKTRGKLGALRKSLLEQGRPLICSECGQLPTWNDKPLVLQLDHKNGDKFDDREENLRFLCPNCHSQTPTFAGRNIKKKS